MALTFVVAVQLVVLIFVLGFIALFFIIAKAYNVKAIIYEQVGLGVKVTTKKAKRSQELSGYTLKFLFSKEKMPLPQGDYFFPISKSTYLVSLYRDKNNNLYPIKLRIDEDNKLHQVPDDRDMRAWLINELQKSNAAYNKPSGWEKYGSAIVIGGALAFAIATIVISGHYYTQSMGQLASSVGGQLGEISQALRTLPTVVPPPTP